MKKYLLFILLFFLFFFCKKDKTIVYEKRFEVISQIFSDSLHNKSFYFKNCLILKKNFIMPKVFYIEDQNKEFIKTDSQLKYLSFILNEKDSLFIEKQIYSNVKKDIDELKEYGFRVLKENTKLESNDCKIKISLPIFNKAIDRFYIIIGEGSSFGEYVFVKEQNNKWLLKERISLTIE